MGWIQTLNVVFFRLYNLPSLQLSIINYKAPNDCEGPSKPNTVFAII